MISTKAYATKAPAEALQPFVIERRNPGPHDVLIDIKFCGICHSDLHQARDEWGGSTFPMVPGHEITGIVREVGAQVTRHKVADKVAVGVFVDSCRECQECKAGHEHFCTKCVVYTYNSKERDGVTPTYGGYSTQIVVDEAYVLRLPAELPLDAAAPLLCAGVTTYSPLKHWQAGPGKTVGVVGLGGLGHMAVKLASAMGAKVTVFSHSLKKKDDALRLGAHRFCYTGDPKFIEDPANGCDLIIDTVSVQHDLNHYLGLLSRDGNMVLVGIPPGASTLYPGVLIGKRRSLAGSNVGCIAETQEMLDFCAKHKVVCDIELIAVQKVNEAYERLQKSDVRYRFVIDCASLNK
jgi:alcohol dehydrogenase (NADP+)